MLIYWTNESRQDIRSPRLDSAAQDPGFSVEERADELRAGRAVQDDRTFHVEAPFHPGKRGACIESARWTTRALQAEAGKSRQHPDGFCLRDLPSCWPAKAGGEDRDKTKACYLEDTHDAEPVDARQYAERFCRWPVQGQFVANRTARRSDGRGRHLGSVAFTLERRHVG